MNYFKVIKEIFLANGNNESDFEAVRDSIEKDREHYSAAKLKEELEQLKRYIKENNEQDKLELWIVRTSRDSRED